VAVGHSKKGYFVVSFSQRLFERLAACQILAFRVGEDEVLGSRFVSFVLQGIREGFLGAGHHFDHFLVLLFGVTNCLLEVLIRDYDFGLFFFGWLLLGFVEGFSLGGNLALGIAFLDSFLGGVLDLPPDSLEVVHILLVVEVVIHLPTHNEF
jgi:hypothetical protein